MNTELKPQPQARYAFAQGVPHRNDCSCCECLDNAQAANELFKDEDKPIDQILSVQPSLAHSDLLAMDRTLPFASDAELDRLIARVESMKLARYIRQCTEAEEKLVSLRADLQDAAYAGAGLDEFQSLYDRMSDQHRIYNDAKRAINELIQRGVKP